MRFILVVLSAVLALALLFTATLSASACVPGEDNEPRCVPWFKPKPKAAVKRQIAVSPKPTAVPTPAALARRGAGPSDALDITDTWQTMDPGGRVWYRIGEGMNPQHLEVWLDAYGRPGMAFSVYSPEQMYGVSWPNTPPKGKGTYNKTMPTHDLTWTGQSPAGGTWYIMVSNLGTVPLQYKLGFNRDETGKKKCISYWEWIGTDRVYWTACN